MPLARLVAGAPRTRHSAENSMTTPERLKRISLMDFTAMTLLSSQRYFPVRARTRLAHETTPRQRAALADEATTGMSRPQMADRHDGERSQGSVHVAA